MANYNYNVLTGTIVPDTSTLREQVAQEWKAAFGEDFDTSPETTQGILITAEANARASVLANNAQIANQINPNLAGGVALDAIDALTGYERRPKTYSSVVCTLAGVAGTLITEGTVANENNDLFNLENPVTLNGGGTASATFIAQEAGPITADANTITRIVVGVIGWETVTNPSDAIPGTLVQSDQGTRLERMQTLAKQANGQGEAIVSNLYLTEGVTSVLYRENNSDEEQVIDGVTMSAHSMYACVTGGTDLAVATTIAAYKGGGCGYSNDAGIPVTVTLTDPTTNQTYDVDFDRPNLIPVLAKVTVSQGNSVTDPTEAVKAAILAYAAGGVDNESGFGIGDAVSAFELAGAIGTLVPGLRIHNVETTKASSIVWSNAEIPIAVFEQATIDETSITVIIVP